MYHQRPESSSSARSNLSNHSFTSASSSSSPRSTPSFPSPSIYGNRLSPADTPHKRNRFKTLFFAPSIRDSGISLSAPTSDPRFRRPVTPPCFPVPGIPIDEEALVQSEFDFLVDELAGRYAWYESRELEGGISDRCDSPTLGNSSVTMASGSRSPIPTRGQSDRTRNNKTRSHTSVLPGASHINTPVNLSIHNHTTTPTTTTSKPTLQRPTPTINPSSPLLTLPHLFHRLAITDPNITGQPIRFLSSTYVTGANSLQVGSCTFMNLPYGAEVECGLRVEPSFPRGVSKQQTVMLQIVQRVVRCRDGSCVWLLCSEVDVSSSFTREVRWDLRVAASTNTGAGKQKQRAGNNNNNNDEDIWTSLAAQLETDSYAPSTTRLPTARPNGSKSRSTTPALSDLLSLLTELRFLHRQFFILQPKKSKTGDVGLSIPYLSSSLHTSLLSFPSKPVGNDRQTKQKDTAHGHDTSIYTSDLDGNSPLAIFVKTAALQAKTWLGMADQTPTIVREVLNLPPMGKNKDGVDEHIGVFGVRVGESWGEGRQGLGCWVCFLVPKGVEKEL